MPSVDFPQPGLPREAHDLAVLDLERGAVHCFHVAAEGLVVDRQAVDAEAHYTSLSFGLKISSRPTFIT